MTSPIEYTDSDFEGLYKFLKSETCNGPALLSCEIAADPDIDISAYFHGVDQNKFTTYDHVTVEIFRGCI